MGLRVDEDGNVYEEDAGTPPATPTLPAPIASENIDIAALARSELPALVKHALQLAHASNRLSDVVSVIKELGDRGYGKAPQSVEIANKVDVNHKIDDSTRETLERFAEYALRKRQLATSPQSAQRYAPTMEVIDVKPTATVTAQEP